MSRNGRNYNKAAYDKAGRSVQMTDRTPKRRNYTATYEAGRGQKNGKTVSRGSQGGFMGEYVYGNTVRKLEPQRQQQEIPVRKPHNEARKNRDKAKHMSAGYVLFLAAALCAAAFILVNYIQLQSELTGLTESVAAKEIQLNYLRISNNEEYSRIVNSIDLEEVKRIAMGELGMVYAQDGQIVEYEGKNNDYMRQVIENNH